MKKSELKKSYKKQRKDLKEDYKSEKESLKEKFIREFQLLRANEIEEERAQSSEKPPVNPPKRAPLEEIGNSVTHCVGAVLAVIALVLMCLYAEGVREYVGAGIYSFGLVIMFTMSCLYHSFPHGSRVKRIFRRFDYSSIYLLIGATFAPILLCYVGGVFGLVFLIIQWVIIATGITLIGVFGPTRLKWIHFPLYILLGWVGVIFIPKMIKEGDLGFLFYILGGGVIYSLGTIPFAIKGKCAHFIWHFFVLAGAIVQWFGIFFTIYRF